MLEKTFKIDVGDKAIHLSCRATKVDGEVVCADGQPCENPLLEAWDAPLGDKCEVCPRYMEKA